MEKGKLVIASLQVTSLLSHPPLSDSGGQVAKVAPEVRGDLRLSFGSVPGSTLPSVTHPVPCVTKHLLSPFLPVTPPPAPWPVATVAARTRLESWAPAGPESCPLVPAKGPLFVFVFSFRI